jgi:hypothetical protein
MPIWVYGRDQSTGNPRDPIFVETENEEAARKEAAAQGMAVDSVELVSPTKRLEASSEEVVAEQRRRGARQYEFTEQENRRITSLVQWMRGFSAILAVSGLVTLFVLRFHWSSLVGAVVALVMALLTFGASLEFQRIVDTKGKDIDHLMDALAELRKFYMLQVLLFVVGTVLSIILAIVLAATT